MATPLYIRSLASTTAPLWGTLGTSPTPRWRGLAAGALTVGADTVNSTNASRSLSETVGTGTGVNETVATVTGATAGKIWVSTTTPYLIFSAPFAADVTISDTVSFDICASESSMNANATIAAKVYRCDHNGALTLIVDSSFGTELTTTQARKSWTASPTSTAMKIGDRLALALYIDDATAVTMASGHTVAVYYNGSNANTADSSVTFTETLSFTTSDPTGSVYYLRDTASDISGAKAGSTTQGSGTVTAVHTTLAGPLAFPGDQWTATAGGSDIHWFLPAFADFTLNGPVQVIIGRGSVLEEVVGVSPHDSLHCELAVCDGDGTNPVVWATSYTHYTTSDTPPDILFTHYLTGPSTAVASSKRIRFRFYSDDGSAGNNQASGTNRTIRYDGTSTYATRLVFTETITEAVATLSPPPFGARYRPRFYASRRRYI